MAFCGVTPCSLAIMYSFEGTYSLLQGASHGCSSFLGIVGVYQTTRRHTLKDMILDFPALKGLFSTLQESQNFFGHFWDYSLYHVQIVYVPKFI
jgi:hypothetical protein